MSPAALSILTTTFSYGTDRVKALGAWGAMGGISAIAGVFLGGLLSAGPGWRWVLFVNPPICALVIVGAFRLIGESQPRSFGIKGIFQIRHAGRRPGHRRDAAAHLRAGPGARRRVGGGADDRRARGRGGAADRLRR